MIFIRFLLFLLASTALSIHAKDMDFRTIQNNASVYIYAEGEIKEDTPKKFLDHFDTIIEGIPYVVFNSDGGSLPASLKLGEIIRTKGISTFIEKWIFEDKGNYIDKKGLGGGVCFSACALAFMGGYSRSIEQGAQIGFHQFYSKAKNYDSNSLSGSQITSAAISTYLRKMGADSKLFEILSTTTPDNIFIPSKREISTLNISTPKSFRNFKLEPKDGLIVARAKHPQNRMGYQIVYELETFCYKGGRFINFYTEKAELGLSAKQADIKTTHIDGFSVTTQMGERNFGKENMKLYPKQRLVATISIDLLTALNLAKGKSGIRFNSPTASGVLMAAHIDADGHGEPAIEASFRNCGN